MRPGLLPAVFLLLLTSHSVNCQVTVDFIAPDTVCVGQTVNITNLTTGGTTYYWSFCSGNTIYNPVGVNIGNPGGILDIPVYMTLVKDASGCYSFVTCQGGGYLVRYFHGTSFNNNPVSWTNLGSFGIIGDSVEGLSIRYDNGQWIGLVLSNNRIARLNFGSSLANTPTADMLGTYSYWNTAHCIDVLNEAGTWVGYVTSTWGNCLVRLNFGSSLMNTPVLTNLGTVGGILNMPSFFSMIKDNGNWYAFVISSGSKDARLAFGSSLLNNPVATDLGQVCGNIPLGGLTLIRDCDSIAGFQLNYTANTSTSNEIYRLNFPNGITGSPTSTPLGNIGNMNKPHEFSEIIRVGDTLFTYVTNRQNYTLTKLSFLPCTNASVGSSTLYNPPPFSYNQAGTFNVQLTVDEGLPTQASLCKGIVVVNPPTLNLGQDKSICQGNTVILDAGAGFSSYLWSTGATSRTITVNSAGTYWAQGTKYGCTASDTVNVNVLPLPPVNLGPDTTICLGQTITFDAGTCNGCSYQWANLTLGLMNIGTGQTYTTGQAAVYMVTKINPFACLNRDTVTLSVSQNISVSVSISASVNPVCAGSTVIFTAAPVHPGTTPVYLWKVNGVNAGTNSSIFTYTPSNNDQVSCVMTSSLTACVTNNPATSNTVIMQVDQNNPVSLTISPSLNPVCAGNTVLLTAQPINEGSSPVYQWKVNGVNTGTNSSTYTYAPSNNDQVSCVMTSSLTVCVTNNPATSNTVIMQVDQNNPVGLTISPSLNPVCTGNTVLFTAQPINEGSSAVYQWKVNGVNSGTNLSTFSYIPANNDQVSCVMTSSLIVCVTNNPATSNTVIMQVDQNNPVSLTISPSLNPVCAGNTVLITAQPINEGYSPVYQWKVNGVNSGTNLSTFSYIPANNDQVSCIMTSSLTVCVTNNPATSNVVTMTVITNLPAGVSISATPNPFCSGTTVNYTASPTNGGLTPAYQWKVNGGNAGTNSSTFSSLPLSGDIIQCVMNSSLSCILNNPTTSNTIVMNALTVPIVSFSLCFDSVTTTNAAAFILKGGIPLGGIFSGPGVNPATSVFSPATAGVGIKTISYSYTNFSLCSSAATKTIMVQASLPFSCGSNLFDIRDNKGYPTVQIGSQCWMRKNLNYGSRISGTIEQTDNCVNEKYCYGDADANCSLYGGLYQWDEVMAYGNTPGSQGLCPPGWHVPTQAEWMTLFNASLTQGLAGKPLQDSIINGFRAIESGFDYSNITWKYQGFANILWSSNSFSTIKALSHGMNLQNFGVSDYYSNRSNAFAVRCLKD